MEIIKVEEIVTYRKDEEISKTIKTTFTPTDKDNSTMSSIAMILCIIITVVAICVLA